MPRNPSVEIWTAHTRDFCRRSHRLVHRLVQQCFTPSPLCRGYRDLGEGSDFGPSLHGMWCCSLSRRMPSGKLTACAPTFVSCRDRRVHPAVISCCCRRCCFCQLFVIHCLSIVLLLYFAVYRHAGISEPVKSPNVHEHSSFEERRQNHHKCSTAAAAAAPTLAATGTDSRITAGKLRKGENGLRRWSELLVGERIGNGNGGSRNRNRGVLAIRLAEELASHHYDLPGRTEDHLA